MSDDEVKDKRAFGYYRVDNEVIDNFGARIGVLGIAIYNFLAKSADWNDNTCFPSYNTIAQKLGISKGTAIKGIQTLVDAGLISHERRDTEKKGHVSNIYTLLPVAKSTKASDKLVQNLDKGVEGGGKGLSDPCLKSEQGGANNGQGLVQNSDKPCAKSEPEQDPSNNTQPNNEIEISARAEKVFLDYCQTVKPVGGTRKRLKLIESRLLEGWSEADFHSVWLGCLRDPWPDRKLHNDITNLLETPERIERMIELSTIDLSERNGNAGTRRQPDKSRGAPRPAQAAAGGYDPWRSSKRV